MIELIFSNILVFLNSLLLTKTIATVKSKVDFIISLFLFYIAQIIFIELLLGILGVLYPKYILGFLIMFLLFNYFLRSSGKANRNAIPNFFNLDSKIIFFAISIFLGFFIIQFSNTFLNPPLGADALIYHLTFPVAWLQNANFNNPFVAFGVGQPEALNLSLNYFPFNGELLFFWFMSPLRNAFLANIAQVPFYLISILTLYSILRKCSIKRETGILMALLWALIPNCFKHLKMGAYIDIMCATLFFMVINYSLLLKEDHSRRHALLLGISCGIFIGLKTLNIFWLLSALPLLIYIILGKPKEAKENSWKILLIIAAPFILFAAYPYARNFILTKNIFYPVTFKLFGKVIMPGFIDRLAFANLTYPFKEFSLKKLFFSEGLGLQFFTFVLPGTFIPFFACLIRKKEKDLTKILLYFIPFCMFMLFLFYIRAYWTRFLYGFLGLGFVSFAVFLKDHKFRERYFKIFGFLSILASIPELARREKLLISLLLSLIIFLLIINLKNIGKLKLIKQICQQRYALSVVASLVTIVLLVALNNKYEKEQYQRYCLFYKEREVALGWEWLNEHTGQGRRIAYAGRPETYPLFGKKLKNTVSYVSVNNNISLAYNFPDGDYRRGKNYDLWLKNLRNQRIDLIFIYQIHDSKEFPIEDSWAREHIDNFELTFQNAKVRIYSLLKEPPRA